jgi:hypothetical protein
MEEPDAKLKYLNRRLLDEYYIGMLGSARAFWDGVTSRQLVAMDRLSGEVKWTNEAGHGFWHNAIAIGGDKVFCIDRVPRELVRVGESVDQPVDASARLTAFDLYTGKPVWSTDENVFGTWLAYSAEHKLLVQAGRRSRDMLVDEVGTRMIAYEADTGRVVWDRRMVYYAPIMLKGGILLTQTDAYDLLTGEPRTALDPLTGRARDWRYTRQYGCGTVVGCENLLTFRSAAAGFYDLSADGGTANLGGFKSGCTANLIPAGGVLNAPDYTRTCTCSYQNQTSLALVHDPSVDAWTFSAWDLDNAPITRMGLNLGAPGDRRADDGTLWLEYPYVGGASPQVPVVTVPASPEIFRRHTSVMTDDPLRWMGSSGMKGLRSITVTLAPNPDVDVAPGLHALGLHALGPTVKRQGPTHEGLGLQRQGPTHEGLGLQQNVAERPYTVRLYFVEPGEAAPGERTFRAGIRGQGKTRLVDAALEGHGPWRVVMKEFKGVRVSYDLTIDLEPLKSAKIKAPVLCGIEVIAEGWENPPIERPPQPPPVTSETPENGD